MLKFLPLIHIVALVSLLATSAGRANDLIILGSTAAAASEVAPITQPLPVTLTRPTQAPDAPTAPTRPKLPTVKLSPDTPVPEPDLSEDQQPEQRVDPSPEAVTPVPEITDTVRAEIEARVQQALTSAKNGDRRSGQALCNAMLRTTLNAAETALVRSCAFFDIPLLELRELMTTDRMRAADELVTRMLRSLPADSEHMAYLKSIKEVTATVAPAADPDGPGSHTMARITRVLEKYRKSRGYFPRDYAELNRLLPANAPPLVDYDIINYANVNNGFSIEIRRRDNPKEVLSLHKSALID